ncbi:MAG: hypothetical protein NVS2B6_16240 [Thermoleophilaceae bacterium]
MTGSGACARAAHRTILRGVMVVAISRRHLTRRSLIGSSGAAVSHSRLSGEGDGRASRDGSLRTGGWRVVERPVG